MGCSSHTLQLTATHCNTLQHTATHCNTLHHTATYCNTMLCTMIRGTIPVQHAVPLTILSPSLPLSSCSIMKFSPPQILSVSFSGVCQVSKVRKQGWQPLESVWVHKWVWGPLLLAEFRKRSMTVGQWWDSKGHHTSRHHTIHKPTENGSARRISGSWGLHGRVDNIVTCPLHILGQGIKKRRGHFLNAELSNFELDACLRSGDTYKCVYRYGIPDPISPI